MCVVCEGYFSEKCPVCSDPENIDCDCYEGVRYFSELHGEITKEYFYNPKNTEEMESEECNKCQN